MYGVGALAQVLDHRIGGAVEHVGIVTGAAGENVGAGVAGENVVELVAGAVDVGAAGQGQVLDVLAEGIVDGRLHLVRAFVRVLRYRVGNVIDDVGVVAGAAVHGIAAGAAVQGVVTAAADQVVVATTADQHVVAARRGTHHVVGLSADLQHVLAGAVGITVVLETGVRSGAGDRVAAMT